MVKVYKTPEVGPYPKLERIVARANNRVWYKEIITVEQILARIIDQRGKCPYCGCMLTEDSLSLDHVQPLSGGGHNLITNIVVACYTCNSLKSDFGLYEFLVLRLVFSFLCARIYLKNLGRKNRRWKKIAEERERILNHRIFSKATRDYLPSWAKF